MTKRSTQPKLSECQNPDHVYVHCILPPEHEAHLWPVKGGDGWIVSACIAQLSTMFVQAPGRHRPRLYCSDECSIHVDTYYMRRDGMLVRAATTTHLTPEGETRSYYKVKGHVAAAADAAGIPKGSPIRTALLTQQPRAPKDMKSLDGQRSEPKVPERSVDSFQSSTGIGAPSQGGRVYGAELGVAHTAAPSPGDRFGDGPLSVHERIGTTDETDETDEDRELREAQEDYIGSLSPEELAELKANRPTPEAFLDLAIRYPRHFERVKRSGYFGDGNVYRSQDENKSWNGSRPSLRGAVAICLSVLRFRHINPGESRHPSHHTAKGPVS